MSGRVPVGGPPPERPRGHAPPPLPAPSPSASLSASSSPPPSAAPSPADEAAGEIGELNDALERSGEHEPFHREDSEPSVDLQQAAGEAALRLPGRRWTCPRCRSVFEEAHERCPDDDFPLVEDMTDVVLASRYLLRRLIGVGGMGSTVWRGWQLSTRRPVAVKLLPATNEKAAARFAREAQIVSNLNHPYITTVHDYGKSEDGKLFLVMELLRGTTLRRLLKQSGTLPVARVLRIADRVLGALDHAHRRGVVHRDLKTGNLFLVTGVDDPDGDLVKVLDFGIAEFVAGEGASRSEDAHLNPAASELGVLPRPDLELRGTPYYMAPEQLTTTRVDARTDLYALGVVLYALLTGRVPFRAATHSELFREILTRRPPPFAEAAPELDIPEAIESFVLRALEKRPEDRFESARAMRAELRALRQALGLHLEESHDGLALPAEAAGAVASGGDGESGGAADATDEPARFQARSRWLALAAALAVLVGGGAWLLFSLLGGGAEPKAPAVIARTAAPEVPGAAASGERDSAPLGARESAAPLVARDESPAAVAAPASAGAPTDAAGSLTGGSVASPAPSEVAAHTAAAPTAQAEAAALATAEAPAAASPAAEPGAAGGAAGGPGAEAPAPMVAVRVESRPEGAAVSLVAEGAEPEPAGTTPLDLRLPRARVTLVFERDGYRTERMELDVEELADAGEGAEDGAGSGDEPLVVEADLVPERTRATRRTRRTAARRDDGRGIAAATAPEAPEAPEGRPAAAAPADTLSPAAGPTGAAPAAAAVPRTVRVEVLDEGAPREFVVPKDRPSVPAPRAPQPPTPKVEVLD